MCYYRPKTLFTKGALLIVHPGLPTTLDDIRLSSVQHLHRGETIRAEQRPFCLFEQQPASQQWGTCGVARKRNRYCPVSITSPSAIPVVGRSARQSSTLTMVKSFDPKRFLTVDSQIPIFKQIFLMNLDPCDD